MDYSTTQEHILPNTPPIQIPTLDYSCFTRTQDHLHSSTIVFNLYTLRPTGLADNRCQQCAGKGKRITRLCPRCKGSKVLDTQHTLAVHIPAGAPEGFEEVFSGEADESTEWEGGDVVVRVRSQKKDGEGGWGRKENGIVGRVVLSVAEVSLFFDAPKEEREMGTTAEWCDGRRG